MLTTALIAVLQTAAAAAEPAAPFPHVRVDVEERVVEFDARVPTVMNDPDGPVVFLEVLACLRDTKEHESLLVTDARPSHVHAALLMLGLEPGSPASWTFNEETFEQRAIDPTGDGLIVEFVYERDGETVVERAHEWVKNEVTGETLPALPFVFAGSRMLDRGFGERYDADGVGTLVGLASFASETIAWPRAISHEAAVDEPLWIADPARVAPVNTPVVVRLRPAAGAR